MNSLLEESNRCLNCKVKPCQKACPLGNDIPSFIKFVKEDNLNWYTAKDTKGNKVIKVSKDQNGLYLWIKVNDKIVKKAEPINISKVSTEAEINEMKTLTNRIKVDANQTTTEETKAFVCMRSAKYICQKHCR